MVDDLITPENVSVQTLRAVLDAAFVDYEIDGDGDIRVRLECRVFVLPNPEKKKIRFLAFFKFNNSVTPEQQNACVNAINVNWIMVRASAADGRLVFDYDLPVDGGLPKKTFVLALRRFASIPHSAVSEEAAALVE